MIPLTVSELIFVTEGELIQGSLNAVVKSFSLDTRTLNRGDFFVPLKGEHFDGHRFLEESLKKGAAGFFSEKWDEETKNFSKEFLKKETIVIKVESGLNALQNMARHLRLKMDIPVVGITGSTGKTCTKDMITSILKEELKVVSSQKNYNNEVGVPLTLLEATQDTQVLVLEMAMRGLGEIAELCRVASPNIGVVTNVGQAHLEFLGSQEAIFRAKGELIRAIPPQGKVILNQDDFLVDELKKQAACPVITFGKSRLADVRGEEIKVDPWGRVTLGIKGLQEFILVNLPVPGRHHVANALAATAVAVNLGVSLTSIRKGLESLVLNEMRTEVFSTPGGVTILNDAYNANPTSMKAALLTLADIARKSRKIAVLGDMLELGELSREAHLKVGELVKEAGVDYLITVGEKSQKIAEEALKQGMDFKNIYSCRDSRQASQILKDTVKPGDVVLLKASRAIELEKALDSLEKREIHG